MFLLITGLCIFLGVHLVPTMPQARAQAVAKFGERGYRAVFALTAFFGFVLVAWGVGVARSSPSDLQLWTPPRWTRHIAFGLMLPALILLVAAYIPSRIHDMVQHPMLAAVKIWAFAHLLANGDLVSLVLFGSFLAYAIYDTASLKKRHALGAVDHRHGGRFNDPLVVALGVALYVAMLFWGHAWLIGVPLLPR